MRDKAAHEWGTRLLVSVKRKYRGLSTPRTVKPSAPVEMTGFWVGRLDARDVFGCGLDVESCEEVGDAFVGEAALAEETDLVGEHRDDLGGGETLLGGAGCFAKLAGGARNLIGGVDRLVLHRDLQTFCCALRR